MPSGGRRQPNPAKGGMYPNRSDMRSTQPVRVATGQEYGQAGQQRAALQAVPLQNSNPAAQAQATPMPQPGSGLARPTDRPGEPITTGVPIGQGPGPEVLAPMSGPNDQIADEIRALYRQFPTEGLRILLEQMDNDE